MTATDGFKTERGDWPRLTETLPHREPGRCNACGLEGNDQVAAGGPMGLALTLTVWREHDRFDKPEARYVVLCRKCSDKLIEPHPRLYAPLPRFAPAPGAMGLCSDCRHRDGCRCTCPAASANGGEGIEIYGPKPARVHVCRSPRRLSGWELWYRGPSTMCTGKEVAS